MNKPRLGLEITSAALRMAALSGGRNSSVLAAKKVDLPGDAISACYASPNIRDAEGVRLILGEFLRSLNGGRPRRAALSLPDSVFRVQTIEFDQLPKNAADRERLVRWRLEKVAAFDISDTVLRYEILRRHDSGLTVLVCVAKREVIAQYENILSGAGLEPWTIGPSSFHSLNFYSPYILRKPAVSAVICLGESAFATLVVENGGVRFYRFKEIKRGNGADIRFRMIREIDDSLHFFRHLDPARRTEVDHLYLTGDTPLQEHVADELLRVSSLAVEVLSPAAVCPLPANIGFEMAAALGAGGSL